MHVFLFCLFLTVGVAVYFTPSMIARRRMKHEAARVLLLNLLLGWTIAGWIGALSWATKSFGTVLRSAENAARQKRHSLETERD
ncbi:superinfection immunity protein [Paraburkholderia sp. C35]|uniref:superinfection immunity protein n=1 Tax=Paraburkholderia sp. C35 TaxID=2126993 RepID=UPI000D69E82E|nr:superinfection immunity protein [Paraburkholderia sp. C35]